GNTVALGQDLRDALSTLPPRQREVVIRRYYLDQSTREVADAMAISEGTVASACHRGLATLRGCLDFVIDGQEVHA
ncbi:MAG: sigma-70 family RNA polymerase sigma factor, partial [Nitriliruptorales bacterium]|nr:sigma-70 family RNA polymerase sigma factor [Nitriliruptorales bacterium]